MTTNKKWIQEAIKNKGALRKTLGVKKGETISKTELEKTSKKKGITGRRARLAKILSKFNR